MSTRWWRCAPVLVVVSLLSAAVADSDNPFGDDEAPRPKHVARIQSNAELQRCSLVLRPTEQRIEAELNETTVLDFDEMPLAEVLTYLGDYHKIPIQIDQKALEPLGLTPDTPVTFYAKKIQLRSALNLLLRPLEMTYTIRDEVLLITTADADEGCYQIPRVYDVANLVVFQDEKGQRYEDYDSLIQLLMTTVAPESWADAGGAGQICPAQFGQAHLLVITQTHTIHHQIAQLLREIDRLQRQASPPTDPPVRPRPPMDPPLTPGQDPGDMKRGTPSMGMGGMMGDPDMDQPRQDDER